MYQAHAHQLLNQKESENDSLGQEISHHPLQLATERLVVALNRLENNLHGITVTQDRALRQEQQMMSFEQENEALRQEREQLQTAMAQLQQEYNALQGVASSMHEKLDDSIKRLSQLIDS